MNKYQFIIKTSIYPLFCLCLFLVGCSSNKKSLEIAEEPLIIPIKKKSIPNEIDKAIKFNKLPEPSELRSFGNLKERDPFSNTFSKNKFINGLTLTGIIFDGAKKYALVEYRERSGVLQKGDIGGISTNLLPEAIQVKRIDVTNQQLVLSEDNEEIFLGL